MRILVWLRNNDDIICTLVTIATDFIVNNRGQAEQQSCKVLSQYHLLFRIYEEEGGLLDPPPSSGLEDVKKLGLDRVKTQKQRAPHLFVREDHRKNNKSNKSITCQICTVACITNEIVMAQSNSETWRSSLITISRYDTFYIK